MKTYIFRVEVEQDADGLWDAEIPVLPGCAVWGYTRAEALTALQEAAQAYLEVKLEFNDPIPEAAVAESKSLSAKEGVTVTL